MTRPIRIGISSCLLGEKLRYDGGHKLDRHLVETLGRLCDFVSVCPEVGCGLPVPREAMRLEGDPAAPRLVTLETRRDLTGQMSAWCSRKLVELEEAELSGFIFKGNSPSCGLFDVMVYSGGGGCGTGRGLFAGAVAEHFPLMPMEEAERLANPVLLESFIERAFAFRR